MTDSHPWSTPEFIVRTQVILDSYERWLGRPLINRTGTSESDAQRLFEAPFVVVAHGTQADPILNYGNAIALVLWETALDQLLVTPSRLTAEPMHRDERAQMLARTAVQGYIDDYQGVRISATGRRFRIDRAIVWNLIHPDGSPAGQAATFSRWVFLDGAEAASR